MILPNFSRGGDENFTMASVGNFCFLFLNLRNPPIEIWEIITYILTVTDTVSVYSVYILQPVFLRSVDAAVGCGWCR